MGDVPAGCEAAIGRCRVRAKLGIGGDKRRQYPVDGRMLTVRNTLEKLLPAAVDNGDDWELPLRKPTLHLEAPALVAMPLEPGRLRMSDGISGMPRSMIVSQWLV